MIFTDGGSLYSNKSIFMKKRVICGGISALLFLALGLFGLFGVDSVINDVILDLVVLDPDNYDVWSAVPGSTGTVTLRRFTMFNFTNPREFLYRGEKPRFHQITNFDYQQRNNFTNCVYSSDKSTIDFDFWLFFTLMPQSRSPQEKVVVPNLAPLGFWSTFDSIDISGLAIKGFGGLFLEMNATIIVAAIGQGVSGQFVGNKTKWNSICLGLGFSPAFCQMLWIDPNYGLSDQNNYEIWVQWAYLKNKDSELVLYKYFGFKRVQMDALGRLLEVWCASIDQVLNNWYCDGQKCQSYDFTLRQLGRGQITNNPPTGVAADSVCMGGNVTCEGFPELFSFYKYIWPKINNDSAYKNLVFSKETMQKLFSPNNGTLLNVGNLSELFRYGQAYDLDKNNVTILKEIQRVTYAETDKHAVVIWQYAKYVTNEFLLKMDNKGIRQMLAMAGVFTSALYQSFNQFAQWAMSELLSLQVAEAAVDCNDFLTRTMDGIDPDKVVQLCRQVDEAHYQNYYRLIQPCQNEYFHDSFQDKYGLSGYEMSELCGPQDESIGQLLKQAHQVLYKTYGCTANLNAERCTEFQLGLKQFINSTITKNPIPSKIRQYPSVYSGHDWDTSLQEWEYRQYLFAGLGNADIDPQVFADYLQLADLLSFDKLFSVSKVQDLLIMQDSTDFMKTFYWKNRTLLKGYVKWVTVEVGFGGFVQTRTVEELLFGYDDGFLRNIKELNPMLGGDPSVVLKVALNEPNSSLADTVNKPQSMYTGYSDPLLTRVYVTNLHHNYITYNRSFYDGYQVLTELANPYKQKVIIHGTDAVQNHPLSDPSINQYIYIDTLFRVGELTYDSNKEKYGFDLLKYVLSENMFASEKEYPPNSKFYQGIKGFVNLSFVGLPIFVGKNHFLGADPIWAQKVDIFDESGLHRQTANIYDDSEIVIEPRTGASFQVKLFFQTNMMLKNDLIYNGENILLPIFTLYSSGNLTEKASGDVLGILKLALKLPLALTITSAVGIVLMAICIYRSLKVKKEREVAESLLESTNEVEEAEAEGQGNIQEGKVQT